MPSSTSSSNQRLPHLAWMRMLGGALLLFAVFVAAMEWSLAARGFLPTVVDSERLWLQQRQRASDLGTRALILVGASRIQLDVDLAVLRRNTGLEPVQLAVDGSAFVPVLQSLAEDDAVRGTIIVSFTEHILAAPAREDSASRLAASYQRRPARRHLPDFAMVEDYLGDLLHHQLRSYADDAQPLTSLTLRVFQPKATPQYLVTLPDRSRLADYTKVPMPAFYYGRVARNLGGKVPTFPGMTYADFDAALLARIDALKPTDNGVFLRRMREVDAMAAAIERRGGRVYFVLMPRSGYVKRIDDRRFPREMFWDRFAASAPSAVLHFDDVPELRRLACPDGSHLDYREREHFTRTLIAALGLEAKNPAGSSIAAVNEKQF